MDKDGYLRVGDRFLAILPAGERTYGKVTRVESIKYHWLLFAAVAANATGNPQAIANLNPPKTPVRIYQVRWGIEPGWRVFVFHPAGKAAFAPDRDPQQGWLTADDVHHLELNDMFELYIAPDINPQWQFQNLVAAQRTPFVYIEGKKYDYRDIDDDDTVSKMKAGEIPYARFSIGSMESIQG